MIFEASHYKLRSVLGLSNRTARWSDSYQRPTQTLLKSLPSSPAASPQRKQKASEIQETSLPAFHSTLSRQDLTVQKLSTWRRWKNNFMSMETKVLPSLPFQLWEERFDFFSLFFLFYLLSYWEVKRDLDARIEINSKNSGYWWKRNPGTIFSCRNPRAWGSAGSCRNTLRRLHCDLLLLPLLLWYLLLASPDDNVAVSSGHALSWFCVTVTATAPLFL